MDTTEKWNKFKEWVNNLSNDEFYEECVECRQVSWGTLECDYQEYFFNLINAYAENKCTQQLEDVCKWLEMNIWEYVVDWGISREVIDKMIADIIKQFKKSNGGIKNE